MNTEWAIKELDTFISQSETHLTSRGFDKTAATDEELTKQTYTVEQIMDRATPRWRTSLKKAGAYENHWKPLRDAALRARESLARQQELMENLGENAPELSAADFHPWIWGGAASLWQSGHFREAVEGAIKKLNAETQNKVGRRDVSETNLFNQAFTLDGPAAGRARLRRMKPEEGDTYRSVQRGAMAFAEGVFAGIRNPLSHEADQELSEQEALEYLAALSVLARWVDSASVERMEVES